MFEFDFIEWLSSQMAEHPDVVLGVGDDAAILMASGDLQVLTTDLLLEGVHFELGSATCEQIGRKALAVSLSDVAAMGAIPTVAVLNFAFPKTLAFAAAQAIFQGSLQLAREFKVAIVGGDTNRWNQGLVVGSTVLGRMQHSGWRLSGAQPGDLLLVSGSLGGSLLGKHLDFAPRCDLAAALAPFIGIHAATDISDSLTIDLAEICRQSQVGVCLEAARIPVAPAAHLRAEQTGKPALEHALFDGEDFELLLAVEPQVAGRMLAEPRLAGQLTPIGFFDGSEKLVLRRPDGSEEPLPIRGYEH
jgi:thiamine-monophosphate kinase